MQSIDISRVPSFYHKYTSLVKWSHLNEAMEAHKKEMVSLLQAIPPERWSYRYAQGKWSIKELVQHAIDTERIFGYRALCIARGDQNPLPGFDEKQYAEASGADKRNKEDLIKELSAVQSATALLFASFDDQQLEASGIVNGNPTYVKAIGFIIVGHMLHHKNILQEHYL